MEQQKNLTLKKTVSRIALSYFAAMVVTLLTQLLMEFICKSFLYDFYMSSYFIWLASIIPLYCFGFPLTYFLFKKIPNDNIPETTSMPISSFIKLFFIGYAFLYFGNLTSLAFSSLITQFTGKVLLNPISSAIQNSNIIITFISTVIIAPLGEEFFFRYLPYKKLAPFGDKVYILVTALFFGLFHMNIFQLLYAFLLGIILAYMYARTRNMLYNISLHMTINFIGGILSLTIGDNEAALIIFGLFVIAAVISGLTLFFKNRRKAIFTPAKIETEHPAKNSIFNLGMLSFILLFIANFIISYLHA